MSTELVKKRRVSRLQRFILQQVHTYGNCRYDRLYAYYGEEHYRFQPLNKECVSIGRSVRNLIEKGFIQWELDTRWCEYRLQLTEAGLAVVSNENWESYQARIDSYR